MAVSKFDHILVVVMENHDYSQIIGNIQAPYINSLAAGGALLTNYTAISHPSEPNSFALYAGSTFGIADYNHYSELGPTLATILQGAGKSFAGYVEHGGASYDHNPWESFPEGFSVEKDFNNFPADFTTLPNVSFVIPNVHDDMHDGTIQQGDTWLQTQLASYAQWARSNNSLLVLTWDEGDSDPTNRVATIFYGAHVVPGSYNAAYNHYNLLSTLLVANDLVGPRNAANAAPIDVFGARAGTLAGQVQLGSALEGVALPADTVIASFTDAVTTDSSAGFTAQIDWGDGTISAGTVRGANGLFTVAGGHIYADEGSFPLSVAITRTADGAGITPVGTVVAAEADVLTPQGASFSGLVGQALTDTNVANFIDDNMANSPSDFTASIDWGDGTISGGTISFFIDTFTVSGTHTYARAGTVPVTVTLTEDTPGATPAVASGTALIGVPEPQTSLHYAPNANIDVSGLYKPASAGFNLADVNSVAAVNALPAGVQALVYLGMGDGITPAFQSAITPFIGNPNVYGFFLYDEPDPTGRLKPLVTPANLKAESDWIHSHDPGAKTFIVMMNLGTPYNPNFMNTYNPANTDIDLFGLDPYPVRPSFTGGVDYNVINDSIFSAELAGIPESQIVPVYQAFGGGGYADYTLPTTSQEQLILATWGSLIPNPAFDFAYSWGSQSGDSALQNSPDLQAVFSAHNSTPPCFARGVRIATPVGETAVEDLCVGDWVLTAEGQARQVRWIGHRRVDLVRHPDPLAVRPVRIRRDAIAPDMPRRTLLVSPDHAVCVDGRLIMARRLLNGASIAQDTAMRSVQYFHVELDEHSLLLADGLPAESYRANANRSAFENGRTAIQLYPDFGAPPLPLLTDIEAVQTIWQRLAARAAALGWAIPEVPVTGNPALRVRANGDDISPMSMRDLHYTFVLPPETRELSLVSRASAPAVLRPWLDDRRRLGVCIATLLLRDGASAVALALDDPALAKGWWEVEGAYPAMQRWTDGEARLSLPQPCQAGGILEVRLAATGLYPAVQPVSPAISVAAQG